MHSIQEKLLNISRTVNLAGLSLREIGRLVGEEHPQKIQHHLDQLAKKGFIRMDRERGMLERIKGGVKKNSQLVAVPIVGAANCGVAQLFADQNIEGYLRISSRILMKRDQIFIIKAVGQSMNRATINGEHIEDGDYVVVDSTSRSPRDGDYVVSVIDEMANIKRFYKDKKHNQIILVSESTAPYQPIYIHEEDMESYAVAGKVLQVIKKPKISRE